MKAAVVTAYGTAPRYIEVPSPQAQNEHDLVLDVLAAGLHPWVRMQAAGSHYTSSPGDLPLVLGMDGVGRGPDGRLWYFVPFGGRHGSMAEQVLIDTRRSYVLPDGCDPATVAATVNCVVASWVALKRRITMHPGQNVLVLGATGGSGRMAVQVARLLGAAQVTAVGREAARLATIPGATKTAVIGDPSDPDIDVVLDFLWGEPATTTMASLVSARPDPTRPLTWINLGEIAGAHTELPAGALRSSRIEVIGSGHNSMTGQIMAAEVPAILDAITRGTFAVQTDPVPLADIERAWAQPVDSSKRTVLTGL